MEGDSGSEYKDAAARRAYLSTLFGRGDESGGGDAGGAPGRGGVSDVLGSSGSGDSDDDDVDYLTAGIEVLGRCW